MGVIVIAGVSFPCGAGELGEVAINHGYDPIFLDHPHNAALAEADSFPVRYAERLPAALASRSGMLIPLLESWVSEGRTLRPGIGLQFDSYAASVSRSKLALTETLAAAGINVVPRLPVETIGQAMRAASLFGYPAVLRADVGYSGLGVWIASNEDELRSCWANHFEERGRADYTKMRSVMGAMVDRLLIEPWIPGDEWSVDCVVSSAGAFPIRVCLKATMTLAGKPVTLGYRLIESVGLWSELCQVVERWSRALFVVPGVSFACFDIRRHPNGKLVPLDFGSRLGGDRIPLLVRRAGLRRNPYAAALDAALAGDPSRMVTLQAGHAIIHAFTHETGAFSGITLHQPGEVIDSKPYGYRLDRQERSGVIQRVGTVLTFFEAESMFLEACKKSAEWITVNFD